MPASAAGRRVTMRLVSAEDVRSREDPRSSRPTVGRTTSATRTAAARTPTNRHGTCRRDCGGTLAESRAHAASSSRHRSHPLRCSSASARSARDIERSMNAAICSGVRCCGVITRLSADRCMASIRIRTLNGRTVPVCGRCSWNRVLDAASFEQRSELTEHDVHTPIDMKRRWIIEQSRDLMGGKVIVEP